MSKLTASPAALALVTIGLLGLGYAIYARAFMNPTSLARIGLWDVLLQAVLTPQFVSFVVLPVWFIMIILRGYRSVEPLRLLRYGSSLRAAVAELLLSARVYWAGVIVTILACVVASVGLPVLATGESGASEILRASGILPVIAVLLQAVLLFCTLEVLQLLLTASRLSLHRATLDAVLAIGIWLAAISSAVGFTPAGSLLDFSPYLNVIVLVQHPETIVRVAIAITIVTAVAIIILIATDQRVQAGSRTDCLNVTILLALIALPLIAVASESASGSSLPSAIEAPWRNAGDTITGFLSYMSVLTACSLRLQFRFDDAMKILDSYLIRAGTRSRWRRIFLVRGLVEGTAIWAVAASASALLALILRGPGIDVPPGGWGIWLYQFVLGGLLQVSFTIVWTFVGVQLLHVEYAGPIVLAGLFAATFVFSSPSGWSPFSAAAMVRVADGWPGPLQGTLAVLVGIAVLLLVLVVGDRLLSVSRKVRT